MGINIKSTYKSLIAGDTLNVIDGRLVGPNIVYTPDMDSAKKSMEKFIQYDVNTVICYHGGVYQENVNARQGASMEDDD